METVLKAIADWIKGILTAGIMSNLSGLFDAVNEQVGDIAQQVGTQPSSLTDIRPIDIENFLKGMRRLGRSDSYISKARGIRQNAVQRFSEAFGA